MNGLITPLVLTFNEAPNIGRTLEKLTWAKEILVLDSFSTDETEAICRKVPSVRFIQRKFDDHTSQWNFGVDQCQSDWILALDADYVLSNELVHELQFFQAAGDVDAYFARFTYCIHGRPLRGTLYPPHAVLFRKDRCRYEPDGHTQVLRVAGKSAWLRGRIFHDDRKSLDRWFASQVRYSELEAADRADDKFRSVQIWSVVARRSAGLRRSVAWTWRLPWFPQYRSTAPEDPYTGCRRPFIEW